MDFSGCNILVIGDIMLDVYMHGTVDRISPEAPIPVLAVTRRDVRIGNAGAVLSNLVTFGAEYIAVCQPAFTPDTVNRDAE